MEKVNEHTIDYKIHARNLFITFVVAYRIPDAKHVGCTARITVKRFIATPEEATITYYGPHVGHAVAQNGDESAVIDHAYLHLDPSRKEWIEGLAELGLPPERIWYLTVCKDDELPKGEVSSLLGSLASVISHWINRSLNLLFLCVFALL